MSSTPGHAGATRPRAAGLAGRSFAVALAVGAVTVAVGGTPAGAHAAFEPVGVTVDSDQTLTMHVPEERGATLHNVAVAVELPPGWAALGCGTKPSWRCAISVDGPVTIIHFDKEDSSTTVDNEAFRFRVRAAPEAGTYWFPTIQTYSDGLTAEWTEAGGLLPAPMIEIAPPAPTTTVRPPDPTPTTSPPIAAPASGSEAVGATAATSEPPVPTGGEDAPAAPGPRSTPTTRSTRGSRAAPTTAPNRSTTSTSTTAAEGEATGPGAGDERATTDADDVASGTAPSGRDPSIGDGSDEAAAVRILRGDDGSAMPVVVTGAVALGLLALGGGLAAQHRAQGDRPISR